MLDSVGTDEDLCLILANLNVCVISTFTLVAISRFATSGSESRGAISVKVVTTHVFHSGCLP